MEISGRSHQVCKTAREAQGVSKRPAPLKNVKKRIETQRSLSQPRSRPSSLPQGQKESQTGHKKLGYHVHNLSDSKSSRSNPGKDDSKQETTMADTAGVDAALSALQSSLASAQQAKKSMQTQFVDDESSLQLQAKNKHKGASRTGRPADSLSRKSLGPAPEGNNAHLLSRSPLRNRSNSSGPPTSKKCGQTILNRHVLPEAERLNSTRSRLIHLLGVRPLSASYLANRLKCPLDQLLELLQRVAKPTKLDGSKFELNDKNYRELDIWSFDYSDQADRDLTRERTISAFDRLRLTPNDPLWQKLLSPEERDKGVILSRLHHLQQGPIQQRAVVSKAPIRSSGPSSVRTGKGPDFGKASASRSRSPNAREIENPKNNAESLRQQVLVGKNKSSSQCSRADARSASTTPRSPDNSKRSTAKPLSKEMVEDSDDEILDQVLAAPSDEIIHGNAGAKTKSDSARNADKSTSPVDEIQSKVDDASPKVSQGIELASKNTQALQASTNDRGEKPVAALTELDVVANDKRMGTSAVLVKAIDASQEGSDTLDNHNSKRVKVKSKSNDKILPKSSSSKAEVFLNETEESSMTISSSNQNDRLAVDGNVVQKQACTKESGTSIKGHASSLGKSKKRPAELDLSSVSKESSIAANSSLHHDFASDHAGRKRLLETPMTAGNADDISLQSGPSTKRQKILELTPPASESPSPALASMHKALLEKAKNFQMLYATYKAMHQSVTSQNNPSESDTHELVTLHNRLAAMKTEIHQAHSILHI